MISLPHCCRLGWRTAALAFALATTAAGQADQTAPTDPDTVLYPRESRTEEPGSDGAVSNTSSPAIMIAGITLFATGGWLWWKFRAGPAGLRSRTPSQLAIEETRALGNRQFLLVVSHEKRRFMLGVCPGRLEMLTELSPSSEDKPVS
jgi:flagellar protein FliO/FliZ